MVNCDSALLYRNYSVIQRNVLRLGYENIDAPRTNAFAIGIASIALCGGCAWLLTGIIKKIAAGAILWSFVCAALVVVCYSILLYSLFSLVITSFLRIRRSTEHCYDILYGLVNGTRRLLCFIATGFAMLFVLRWQYIPEAVAICQERFSGASLASIVELSGIEQAEPFIMGLTLSLCVFWAGRIALYALDFYMHTLHYSERIKKSQEDMRVLQLLGSMLDTPPLSYRLAADKLTLVLGDQNKEINVSNLERFFGRIDAALVMARVDHNRDSGIAHEEIALFYHAAYNEMSQLATSLGEKDAMLARLHVVFVIIEILLALLVISACLGAAEDIRRYSVLAASAMVGAGYIFSAMAIEIFQSLIFVIFVRPYEVGDAVMVDGKHMLVTGIGITRSTFILDSLHYEVPTKKLMQANIYNIRKSKCIEELVSIKLCADQFLEKRHMLEEKLDAMICADLITYKQKCEIEQYRLLGNATIEVNIRAFFRVVSQDISSLRKYKDEFLLRLHEILKDIDLSTI